MNTIIEAKSKVDVLSAEGTTLAPTSIRSPRSPAVSVPLTGSIDRTTNLPVDEFASKKAAQDEADYLNDEDPRPAPATDANGNDIWGLWASLPGRHDKEVTVTTDSAVNRSAIGNFLLDEGFTVYAD